MKKLYCIFAIFIFSTISCSNQMSVQSINRDVLIKKYLKDKSTYIIICKGYPKQGTEGMQAVGTAKEAALLNAQIIAKQTFIEDFDVIKNGIIDNYDIKNDHVVIKYKLVHPDIKRYLK